MINCISIYKALDTGPDGQEVLSVSCYCYCCQCHLTGGREDAMSWRRAEGQHIGTLLARTRTQDGCEVLIPRTALGRAWARSWGRNSLMHLEPDFKLSSTTCLLSGLGKETQFSRL